MEELSMMVGELMVKYPAFAKFAMVVGFLRLGLKPVMSCINSIVEITPSKKDDEVYKKVVDSRPYKWMMYCLDWFASIKVKK